MARTSLRAGALVCSAIAVSALAACVGVLGDTPPDTSPNDEPRVDARELPSEVLPPFSAAPAAIKRLTQPQIGQALRLVFGDGLVVPPPVDADPLDEGFTSPLLGSSTYTHPQIERFESDAHTMGRQVLSDATLRSRFLGACVAVDGDEACLRDAMRKTAERLFREAVAATDVDGYLELARASAAELGSLDLGLASALAAMMQSPRFLYRIEIGVPDGDLMRYSGYEMATRLAFFIWGSGPDDSLLSAASSGQLETREGVAQQAERLFADPRARQGMTPFFRELLHIDGVDSLTKDEARFPGMSRELAVSMQAELLDFVDAFAFANQDFLDILVSPVAFADSRLARHYGLTGTGKIAFAADSPRAGFLTTAGFLAIHATPTRGSPTRRGLFVRSRLLCDEIPPPPANAGSLDETVGSDDMRTRMLEHQRNPGCASCHVLMDPLGFGLEAFDGNGGVFADHKKRDLSGDLDGATFADARALSAAVRASWKLGDCITRRLYRSAVSHTEVFGEERSLREMRDAFASSGNRIEALVIAIATSDAFRYAKP